jgi:hypothetical protein
MERQQSCRFDFTNYILLQCIVDRLFSASTTESGNVYCPLGVNQTRAIYLASSISVSSQAPRNETPMNLKRSRRGPTPRFDVLTTLMDTYVDWRDKRRAVGEPDRRLVATPLDAPVRGWRAFRRLTQLSFPRSYPIVQFPSAPLVLAFISGLVAHYAQGQAHSNAEAVSYLSMAVWAYLELFQGVNAFRRLLGLTYTLSTAIHLATALHH